MCGDGFSPMGGIVTINSEMPKNLRSQAKDILCILRDVRNLQSLGDIQMKYWSYP